jgi:hypothetical protein
LLSMPFVSWLHVESSAGRLFAIREAIELCAQSSPWRTSDESARQLA